MAQLHAVTNGVSIGSGWALAHKLLNWDQSLPSQLLAPSWRLDPLSFLLGLLCGIAGYLLLELWFTCRLAVHLWLDRHRFGVLADHSRQRCKSLYKLC